MICPAADFKPRVSEDGCPLADQCPIVELFLRHKYDGFQEHAVKMYSMYCDNPQVNHFEDCPSARLIRELNCGCEKVKRLQAIIEQSAITLSGLTDTIKYDASLGCVPKPINFYKERNDALRDAFDD